MAELRKSGKAVAARQRARERAATFREQQDRLEQLATDYFVSIEAVEAIDAEADREIAAIRERAGKRRAAAQADSEKIIGAMLDLAPKSEVAERLGIAPREVRRAASRTRPGDGAKQKTDDVREHVERREEPAYQ